MKMVVGLGNPGKEYRRSRHNIGFWVIDLLASRWQVRLSRKSFGSVWGKGMRFGEEIFLVKPHTYMNRSGEAVAGLRDALGFAVQDLIAVHDDMDLAIGRVRIKANGGSGGHQGVSSLIAFLAEKDFFRVKVGIGRPAAGEDATHFVLASFTFPEESVMRAAVARAAEAVEILLDQGGEKAMSLLNVRPGKKNAGG